MRVLVVEDEARVASFVARGLREQSYAVDVAGDGETALFQAAVNAYDIVVLDVMLPGFDGLEVCRRLRAQGASVPVLMLTAKDAVEDRVAGLDSGADDYLTKPFAVSELLARVRALLRRGPHLRRAIVSVSDLRIDTAARRVWRSGRAIELTTKEYALLEYLARNAGRIVTRAEIAEHVWDESYDAFVNVIEVYISRLRRRIDQGDGGSLIHTKRGVGYMLAEAPAESDDAP